MPADLLIVRIPFARAQLPAARQVADLVGVSVDTVRSNSGLVDLLAAVLYNR